MHAPPPDWSPDSFRTRPEALRVAYPDAAALDRVLKRLRALPPLVTAAEIERLRTLLADAASGRRFVLQGGDCAEVLDDCTAEKIDAKLRILLRMSDVLARGLGVPVVTVGRLAGQYAKARTHATETRDGVTLPNYFGDLVNRPEFTADARRPDPSLLLEGHSRAALVLNHVRALARDGFSDLEDAGKSRDADVFTSHEALHLDAESAQVRFDAHHGAHYAFSAHFPWIGERTRQPDGAHVELLRGVRNPVAVKLGPTSAAEDVRALVSKLDPANEPGRLAFVTRLGAGKVETKLPELLRAARDAGSRALWLCDPMHGNTRVTRAGVKTRSFEDVLREVVDTARVHAGEGSRLGGLHVELTPDDVTECTGGPGGVGDDGLHENYASLCDPRLNPGQSLALVEAFVAGR